MSNDARPGSEHAGAPDEDEVRRLRERVAELERVVADRERFRVFFEHAPDAVYLNDAQGVFLDGNPAAEKLIGYSRDDIVGHSFLDLGLLPPEELPAAALLLARNLRGENTGPDEFHLRRRDGTLVPVEIITFPVQLEDGALVVGFARETTARKRMEEELRQAHKMEAIGKLAGGLAHDFNNLLMAITGYAEVLQHRMGSTDPGHGDVEEILEAAERGASLTRQLLAFSRGHAVNYEPLHLNTLVADTIELLRPMVPEDIEFEIDTAPDAGSAHGDAAQIMGVLVNLSVNAADSMPGGGKLTIATRRVAAAREFEGSTIDANRYAMLSVTDTGSGMDKATLERVFDPFFTTKDFGKATGMGLSTAYGIVNRHGGEITVSSEPGSGTTFRVYLPLSGDAAAATDHSPETEADRSDEDVVVLLVEDQDQVRDVVHRILEGRGYEVILAAGAAEAIDKLEDEGPRISLLLTDVVMPGRSGPDLYAEAAAKHPELKVLFMTGYANRERQATSAALRPLIRKPFGTQELISAVRAALDG